MEILGWAVDVLAIWNAGLGNGKIRPGFAGVGHL